MIAYIFLNLVDRYLNGNRNVRGDYIFDDPRNMRNYLFQEPLPPEPQPIVEKTEEELNDYIVTKVSNNALHFNIYFGSRSNVYILIQFRR